MNDYDDAKVTQLLNELGMPDLKQEMVHFAIVSCMDAMRVNESEPELSCSIEHLPVRDAFAFTISAPIGRIELLERWDSMKNILSNEHLAYYLDRYKVEEKDGGVELKASFFP